MIFPMMVGVDFSSSKDIGRKPKGLIITLVVNWLVKPFTMAALAVLFFDYLYAGLMSESDADQYIAGLIILGAAPCTAMVFVWSQLTKGDPAYTLVQVSVNDLVMIVAFRSEEHTSELQSLMRISYAVFCLKKKTNDSRKSRNQL